MKLIEVVGSGSVILNNQESQLVSQLKSMIDDNKDVNILSLSDRLKQVAYDLYLRNVILIDDGGFMSINEEEDADCIRW